MTPSELKEHVEKTRGGTHFFDHSTMRAFGDTMANYGVRADEIETYDGPLKVWCLYRKRPVKYGNQQNAYFDQATFQKRSPK